MTQDLRGLWGDHPLCNCVRFGDALEAADSTRVPFVIFSVLFS